MITHLNFIKTMNRIYYIGLLLLLISCKNIAKDTVGEIAEEATEKLAKETSEEVILELSEQAIKRIEWDELLDYLRKNNKTSLSKKLTTLDDAFQKKVLQVIRRDNTFFRNLSYESIDEFSVFTKEIPELSKNVDLFQAFVKANNNISKSNFYTNIILKEENGSIKFLTKGENKVIGSFRKGIFSVDKSFKNSDLLLRSELIPNSIYKIKGDNFLEKLYNTDELGRVISMKGKNLAPNDLLESLTQRNIDLKSDFIPDFNKLKQSSKGNNIDVEVIFKYSDDAQEPSAVIIKANTKGKNIIRRTYTNRSSGIFSTKENLEFLETQSKFFKGLNKDNQDKLLANMIEDPNLVKSIRENPQKIQKWLNTRNHVDQSKILRTAKGDFPINSKVYAGNVYYFDPSFNPNLKNRLMKGKGIVNLRGQSSLSYEDFMKLDRDFSNGVPFSKQGFPDFSEYAFKDKTGKIVEIDLGSLTGDRAKDIALANKKFKEMGFELESGYTWHHIENSSKLIRVNTAIHQLVDHSGGVSTLK
jgi:hypothetical protein